VRYVVEDARWYDTGPLLPAISAPELKPVDTGLLDRRGRKILRAPEPVGFHRAGVSRQQPRGIDPPRSEGR
jgi:hypothetical protein